MEKNENIFIQDDSPICSIKEDRFGRRQFVKNLAKALLPSDGSSDSKVIALTGSWGVGKTSVVNMLKNEMTKYNNKKFFIINFNPWQYTKTDDLIKPFLEELYFGCNKLKRKISKYYKSLNLKSIQIYFTELITSILSFLGFVASIPKKGEEKPYFVVKSYISFFNDRIDFLQLIISFLPVLIFLAFFIFSLIKFIYSVFNSCLNTKKLALLKQKEDISNSIRKNDYHFLIIVDDIDRLTPEETLQMFRIIRTNADFANTTYLLAFDKNVVVENLNNTNVDGTGFVEKITTLEYQLFEPARFYLRQYLVDEIDEIYKSLELKKQDYYKTDNTHRFNKIIDCILNSLKTMRDVKRYLNSLKMNSQVVVNNGILEVNFLDYIALQCIQLKYPDLYYGIKKNKKLLTSDKSVEIEAQKRIDNIKATIKQFINSDNEDELLLLLLIFPNIHDAFKDKAEVYLSSTFNTDIQESRICSSEYFDEYFSSGINLDDPEHISNSELFEFESCSYEKNKMIDFLLTELKKDKLASLLFMIKEVCTSKNFIPEENASHFVAAMFETECLEHCRNKNILERNNRDISKDIINSYLHQFITDEKLLNEIFVKAADECACVYPVVSFIYSQIQAGKNQSPEFLFEKSDISKLKNLALQKLLEYKKNFPDNFWNDDDLLENIGCWHRLDAEKLKASMKEDISTDEKLCEVMIKLYKKRIERKQYFPYDILGTFTELDDIKSRLEKYLNSKNVNEDNSIIAEYFIKNYKFKDIESNQLGDERLKRFDEEK